MISDDVAAIAQNAVDIFRAAVTSGLPTEQAELVAVAHTVVHWPSLRRAGHGRSPEATAVCMVCMLDQTLDRPDLQVISWTGELIELVECS